MLIGAKIAAQRTALGWTQQELADKLYVTRQTISKWELDKSQPDLDALALMCQLLHLDVRKLLQNPQHYDHWINDLLGAPAMTVIAPVATQQPFYVRARLAEEIYPQPVQQIQWLTRQIDRTRAAVGRADFGQQLALSAEDGQPLATIVPSQAHFTIALLWVMRLYPRYLVLVSVRVGPVTYRLLISSLRVIPALCDWLTAHAPSFSDPMQLNEHRDTIDWARLSKADFEKLAANTPYWFPYQNNGSPRWT